MKTKPHWCVVFDYTCTLSSPFFLSFYFHSLSLSFVFLICFFILYVPTWLQPDGVKHCFCVGFDAATPSSVSTTEFHMLVLSLCFFSILDLTVIVNSLYIWSLTFLFFGVCVWYFLRVFCFCGSSSGVLGLCIWVLYYVCSFISGLLFVLFCWYSCWAVLFFDCNSHLTFVSF